MIAVILGLENGLGRTVSLLKTSDVSSASNVRPFMVKIAVMGPITNAR